MYSCIVSNAKRRLIPRTVLTILSSLLGVSRTGDRCFSLMDPPHGVKNHCLRTKRVLLTNERSAIESPVFYLVSERFTFAITSCCASFSDKEYMRGELRDVWQQHSSLYMTFQITPSLSHGTVPLTGF